MIILTTIATIIHMNYGFEFPEALGRGVVSALIVALVFGVISTILWLLCILYEWFTSNNY